MKPRLLLATGAIAMAGAGSAGLYAVLAGAADAASSHRVTIKEKEFRLIRRP